MASDNIKTSENEVVSKGKGGLRRSFLVGTILPLFLMGVVFLTAGAAVYSRTLQKEMSNDLADIAETVLMYYDYTYPGEYGLLIDNAKNKSYLQKGGVTISDDTSFIDDVSERTGADITLFFYDTRMMTTITDSKGERLVNTIANTKIVDGAMTGDYGVFFDSAQINRVRYCVQYLPIRGDDGTFVGMIGVAEPYAQVQSSVRNIQYINFAIIVLTILVMALWMVKYSSTLVAALNKLRDFLGDIARGELDTNLDNAVLERDDEIADMGRFTLFVRQSLKKMIEKDPLTNLNNRRSGQSKMRNIRGKVVKYGGSYSVAMGDIDHFKRVNDTYGHDAGDAVLKEVARILSNHLMGKGTVIRWGGEEFLFIFDGLNMPAARDELWNILYEVRETSVEYEGQTIQFTMSFGVVEGNVDTPSDKEITAADELLYYAKEHGRNQVISELPDDVEETKEETEEDNSMSKADKSEERWDIYDANKNLTGRTMKRNDWTLADDEYHLTVLGVVATKDGRYLITKRVMTKAWAPGWWEVSGGAAMAGETSEEAVRREVLEETGLDVSGADGGYEFTYHRENPGEGDNYFVDIYRYELDFDESDIKLQEEETDGYMLATASEIAAFGEEGIFLHYDSIKQVFR